MKKKIISAALAAIMAASALSTSAFAALDKADNTLTASSVTAVPTLKVTMPKSLSFVINPYKLTVDAKGKIDTESNEEGAQIIPVYGENADSWDIVNESAIGLNAYIYATVKNGNTTDVQIIDVNNENKDATTGKAADAKKRQIHLSLTAAVDDDEAEGIAFALKAPTAWKNTDGTAATGVTKIEIGKGGTLKLAIDEEASKCVEATPGTLWTAKDTATLSLFFKFEFASDVEASTTPVSDVVITFALNSGETAVTLASDPTVNLGTSGGSLTDAQVTAAATTTADGMKYSIDNGTNWINKTALIAETFTSSKTILVKSFTA